VRIALLAVAAFALALSLRVSNARFAELSPVDELYHLKRMTHFVDFDVDRNAFCPWPPLYDRAFGALAHGHGLTWIRWFPPIFGALFVALTVVWIDRRFGRAAAIAAGIALATSPFIVTQSWVASIDHHWTEPIFVVAIIAALIDRRPVLLGVALTAAMFVQTALLVAAAIAAALAYFGFWILDFGLVRAATISFGIPAVAIALYRATRPPGYPDNAWFLGWTHAALFAAAAVACATLSQSKIQNPKSKIAAALASAAAIVLATPTAPSALLGGLRFFGGEPWLQTINEFQPLWKAHPDDLLSIVAGLGIGAILVWPLALRGWREKDTARGTVAVFAILYLLLTITSRRFWSVSIPLLAIAAAIQAKNRVILAAVALIPAVQFVLWMQNPTPPPSVAYAPWFRAARFLHEQPPGRVLAPWSVGHLLDVDGGRAIVIDNFGTMPDDIAFARAHDAFLTTHEESLARYCDDNGIRFVAYEPPRGMRSAAAVLGFDIPPKLAARTVWSRAWSGAPLAFFRRVYARDGIVIVERR